ncbi:MULTISPECIES: alpha/beta hydrolase family protein [Paenibacillus]|uniref:Prolyl oligopeptidase family protein n=1 Tax=Paenibacillus pabuli TaxID=1472 RepID=A0A855YA70_9BACL|nr:MULTISPECIES: alpha/beta fold hydrolase [Paenibacillus]PWW42165.1 prolyl oligopeptidase family protein [Paenibacillus pabuli]PXW07553.1 prolyl oligopeptidase family protein [Paenibacillus taichungensis]
MRRTFLTRMSINRERTGMLLSYDNGHTEWCTLDETGQTKDRHWLYEHTSDSMDRTEHIQFIAPNQVLIITQGDAGKRLHLYEMQAQVKLVHTCALQLPFAVLQAAWQDEKLQLLFAIRNKGGSVRLGLYDTKRDEARWITANLNHPQLAFWSGIEQEIGLNVDGQGRVYSYRDKVVQSAEWMYTAYPYPVMDKQGDIIAVSIPSEQGFKPGWLKQGEDVVHELFPQCEAFSELARVQIDLDTQKILCEGITCGRWHYVQYALQEKKEVFQLRDYPGTLTQAVLSRDKQGLVGKYETIATAPRPGLFRFQDQTNATPWVQGQQEVITNGRNGGELKVEYGEASYRSEIIPYLDIHPKGAVQAVIYLHGGPHNCLFDSYSPVMKRLSEAGVRVIGLNYPGSSGFTGGYRSRNENDWGGVDADVVRFIREQVLSSYSDVALYGVSYGAYLALLAAGRDPVLWSAVVACAPFTDLGKLYTGGGAKLRSFLQKEIGELLEDESVLRTRSPVAYASALSGSDILFIHGQADQLCPVEQTEQIYQEILKYKLALDEPSGRLELHIIKDLEHEIYSERFWAQKAVDFLTFTKVGQAK